MAAADDKHHSATTASKQEINGVPLAQATAAANLNKPKKKICCACPDTKKARDECIVINGEDACAQMIEAHKVCLRSEGFNV